VRVVASSTLWDFVKNRVSKAERKSVDDHLRSWLALVERAQWKNSSELKADFRSASIVTSERVVFNIKGNNYRLVAAINYQYQIVLVKWLGTHGEYDHIDVKTVMYDKERYANPSNTN
jgi:mRNA interferase HigB